jgi:hypothetical protein
LQSSLRCVRALQQHLSLEGDDLALLGGAQRAHQRLKEVAAALVLHKHAKLALPKRNAAQHTAPSARQRATHTRS